MKQLPDVAERVSKLTPAQRARLLERLVDRGSVGTPRPAAPQPSGPFPLGQSFACRLQVPGNYQSLSFEAVNRTKPGPGQVQIEAKAASLNFRDLMIAMNLYPSTPGVPSNMGSDYAGIITACGPGVERFKPGDEVMALSAGDFSEDGGLSEGRHFSSHPNIAEQQVAPKPPQTSFLDAAAMPTVFLTALYSLRHLARLSEGERILIHTAAGGVGQAAIQIARLLGAEIFATAGSDEKRNYLRSSGIENVMDSRTLGFAAELLERTRGEGVDVVLNTLSGEGLRRGLEVLKPFGRFIQLDKRDFSQGALLPMEQFKRGILFAAVDLALFLLRPEMLRDLFDELVADVNANRLRPLPRKVFPIWHLDRALLHMSQAKYVGKLVVSFEG